ncbi:putative LPS assembly protein LptD [Longimicrobium terrae]|uniref:Lipopolysaccharide export system protein LptA n=1 Tax=Longimicrobium terrae TaxID=1639882 RepID=A0A841GQP7_9BACT|nr:putative LPS assembly protein LptD [Longimicrobium terrae]MBB4634591.1 lipopolysaccharide export system protein LptA [Longimicrobium terrae]MBB6068519.1 lipopolysaccharide export system protein LptA [Longimicrobium terrae]NNC27709.1 LPS-assembly protein LptD [Longimicrobium terrae]
MIRIRVPRLFRAPVLASLCLALLAVAAAAPTAAAQRIPPPRGGRAETPRPGLRPAPDSASRDTTPRREVVQDSLIDELLRLEGYVPVEYQGDSASFSNADRTLRLRGNPVVTREGTRLQAADSIVYRERSDFVEVYGRPQVTGEGQDIKGDVLFYDLNARRTSVRGAQTAINESGATWFVRGNVTAEDEGTRVYATGSTFTSDDREDPAYYFKADRIKVIRNRILVGRPAYLYFRNVPVFVLPFIVKDLAQGRASGVLIPRFDVNDIVRTDARGDNQRGTGRQVSNIGYYWAINDYMGASLAYEWRSQSWQAVTGGYEFNWRRRFLRGNVSFQQFWRETGTDQNINGLGSWLPDERTTLNASANYTSNTRFERNRSIDPARQTSDISSTFALSRRMDWGQLATGGELRQSIATGDKTFRSTFNISPQTITLFPAGEGGARWYNDGALTLGTDLQYDQSVRDEGFARRLADEWNAGASLTSSIRFGSVGVGGGIRYASQNRDPLLPIDSTALSPDVNTTALGYVPGQARQTLDVNASTSYEFRLMGNTRLSPSISVSQNFLSRSDTASGLPRPGSSTPRPNPFEQAALGSFVGAAPRVNFGAALQTELFGFFPGVAGYSAIRHHIRPGASYVYSPAVRQTARQEAVFGAQGGAEQNQISFNLDQTFEAKVRRPVRSARDEEIARAGRGNAQNTNDLNPGLAEAAAPGDSTAAVDSAGGPSSGGDAPDQDRKITLLAINTGAVAYSFVPTDIYGRRFQTDDLSNTLRSDLFGGFQVSLSHDLFRERVVQDDGALTPRSERGTFAPFLTSLQTSVSFGANSALFRWMGFARASEDDRAAERGRTPAGQGQAPIDPPGAQTSTGREVVTGTGGSNTPWNAQVAYSLRRRRADPLQQIPQVETDDSQQLSGSVSFYPTRNWAVSWRTDYSITRSEFGTHVLNLKRDLYRWQANFDFIRTPTGNTSFSFSVHLIDLPDLKTDYRRQNLGTDRATTAGTVQQ